jgi:hypothetical protein
LGFLCAFQEKTILDLWFLKQNKTHKFRKKRKKKGMILDHIGSFNYMKFLKSAILKKITL